MNVTMVKVADIVPYGNNPRNNEAAVKPVQESIKQFGFRNPIILDKDNVIIAGHTRLEAAKALGMVEVPCLYADDLSEDQVKKYRLVDNKTAEYAVWDFSKLADELKDLDFGDFDFDFGSELSDGGVSGNNISEDNYDTESPVEPKAKVGDLYKLGEHRLICGDSTDAAVIDRLMGGQKANMVFTDPPYGVDYAGKNAFLNECQKGNRIQDDIIGDNLKSAEEERDRLWIPALKNARNRADDYCAYYITSPQGGELLMMMMAIRQAGWQLKHMIIWNKNNQVLGRCDYNYKHEPILYGWNKQHRFYGMGSNKTSVWDISKPLKNDLHPTMKPIELIVNCLLNSTKENDNVLDVFGGSGSTLIACEQSGRKCYMCELDPHYVDVIIDRWEKLTGKKAELIEKR